MEDLKDKTLDELKALCRELGFPAFKAKEIYSYIHKKLKTDLKEFTTLKLEERERLGKSFIVAEISANKTEKGRNVEKVAFQLHDGKVVESVFMDYKDERKTVCVSSQAGCPIGCLFCATGQMGPGRNLTTSEILSQIYYFAKKSKISNLVFMGMGEPFLNYDNVLKAIAILNNESGLNIAARKIVVSTIGILSGIERFANESKQLRLAWSLAAPFDETRRKLIKYKNLPSIEETINALKQYQQQTKRRITIEYVLLKGTNDRDIDVNELAGISARLDCHLNLIPYNPSPGLRFQRADLEPFWRKLKKAAPRVNVTVRQSFGQEISAACGQLSTLLK
ncbi:MAG: 23S rRNA (adenine(2503)-C(2))-methyltransferase RlmN [Candidatus Margulisbacteria bacterium]|nr:23S rRNA (adenine(2503)-C(2))-methyltransferase RlmN [Candidatus Margulisiibacteriota bacterium]